MADDRDRYISPLDRVRGYQEAEERRVRDLLQRDRIYADREVIRRGAMLEVDAGRTVNIVAAVDEPTPEQMNRAARIGQPFRRYTPRLEDGTSATVVGYRRDDLPAVRKMLHAGVIDLEGLVTCQWYREVYERSGMVGAVSSTDYSREVFSPPHERLPFTSAQVEAQDELRVVRKGIARGILRLLDAIVLHDVPVSRAQVVAQVGWRRARQMFAAGVADLLDAREQLRSPEC